MLADDGPAGPQVSRVETHDVTDLRDDRKLAGLADDIFVGEVVARAGETTGEGPNEALPETQFTVEVRRAIKGSLSGQVVVNQQGGFRSPNDKVLMEGDALVEPGKTYLFVTRTYTEKGWHTLVPVHGNVLVRDAAHRQDLERRFAQAHRVQVPFNPAG